jgi:hypothetical protein
VSTGAGAATECVEVAALTLTVSAP